MDGTEELPIAETITEDESGDFPRVRDRIVILGRRAAGKTVYLSVLYEKHWRSLRGLTMRAISGNVHSECMRVIDGLRGGRWPAATLATRHWDLEVGYKGRKRLLVALDYAGEIFRRAFVEDDIDSPETRELVKHIDSAAAVIILVDPASACGADVEARIDDDFGVVQAVGRIRNWPGGDEIPVVLVLTKGDEHGDMIKSEGGLERFVAKHFPALARLLVRTPIFKVSAVQAETDGAGRVIPKKGSAPVGIDKPLLYCLDGLEAQDVQVEQQRAAEARRLAKQRRRELDQKAARQTTRLVVAIVVSMIVLGACIAALVIAAKL